MIQSSQRYPGITTLCSGAQTGADRAALDVAIRHGFPHGGWCPKGRRAEDGRIGGQYSLRETPSAGYLQRTEWNVRDTDATVIFTLESVPTSGSLRTIEFAVKYGKPWCHISRQGAAYSDPARELLRFVREHKVSVLNVAGTRESNAPGIYHWVRMIIEDGLFWGKNHPYTLGGPGEG